MRRPIRRARESSGKDGPAIGSRTGLVLCGVPVIVSGLDAEKSHEAAIPARASPAGSVVRGPWVTVPCSHPAGRVSSSQTPPFVEPNGSIKRVYY